MYTIIDDNGYAHQMDIEDDEILDMFASGIIAILRINNGVIESAELDYGTDKINWEVPPIVD